MPQGTETGGLDCCAACALGFLPPVPAPASMWGSGFKPAASKGVSFGMPAASSGRDGGFGPAAPQKVRAWLSGVSSGRDEGFGDGV